MRPTVEELHQSGQYRLLESFSIDAMMAFVLRELNMKPRAVEQPVAAPAPGRRIVRLFGAMVFGGAIGYGLTSWLLAGMSKEVLLGVAGQFGVAVAAFFLLLPLHEFIHGLVFKSVGAPRVRYGWSLKSLMVYAYSQKFPTTTREVAYVAVMPFLVITGLLLIGWVIWPAYGIFWGTLTLIHASGCIGDLALIVYWYKNRRRIIYTYDDVENERRTYFFEAV